MTQTIPEACPFSDEIVEIANKIGMDIYFASYPLPFLVGCIRNVQACYYTIESLEELIFDSSFEISNKAKINAEKAKSKIEEELQLLSRHGIINDETALEYINNSTKKLSEWKLIKDCFEKEKKLQLEDLQLSFIEKNTEIQGMYHHA